MATVAQDVLASCPVLLASTHEQDGILQEIDAHCERVDASINHSHREIELLREYRTRLIADVVTGKLDVREAAARLPDETEEPELPHEEDAITEDDATAPDDHDAGPAEAEA